MNLIKIKLKDGSIKEVLQGTTLLTLAESISKRLSKEALAGEVNGTTTDLSYVL
jgi:threonyl-tRNA synthetase